MGCGQLEYRWASILLGRELSEVDMNDLRGRRCMVYVRPLRNSKHNTNTQLNQVRDIKTIGEEDTSCHSALSSVP